MKMDWLYKHIYIYIFVAYAGYSHPENWVMYSTPLDRQTTHGPHGTWPAAANPEIHLGWDLTGARFGTIRCHLTASTLADSMCMWKKVHMSKHKQDVLI